jgi:hypothetical protein
LPENQSGTNDKKKKKKKMEDRVAFLVNQQLHFHFGTSGFCCAAAVLLFWTEGLISTAGFIIKLSTAS